MDNQQYQKKVLLELMNLEEFSSSIPLMRNLMLPSKKKAPQKMITILQDQINLVR
jgi:hypothetical protein